MFDFVQLLFADGQVDFFIKIKQLRLTCFFYHYKFNNAGFTAFYFY